MEGYKPCQTCKLLAKTFKKCVNPTKGWLVMDINYKLPFFMENINLVFHRSQLHVKTTC